MSKPTSKPTLGDYCAAITPILGAVEPQDTDCTHLGEPAILVGFTDMVPVTGQQGLDPLCAFVTFDRNRRPSVNFEVYGK